MTYITPYAVRTHNGTQRITRTLLRLDKEKEVNPNPLRIQGRKRSERANTKRDPEGGK